MCDIYERPEKLDLYSVDELLTAHSIMIRSMVEKYKGQKDTQGSIRLVSCCDI